MTLAAVIADDLTGAADTGVQFVRAGYKTAVVFRGRPAPSEDLDAVVFDTDSRTMPPRPAARRVAEAGRAARGARIVYKKIDSTLRGPVAAELSAALEATGRERGIVAPAFPAAGRTTAEGVQLVHGVPVHETEMKNDPRTPVRVGHVPSMLEGPSASVGTVAVEDLEDPERVRRVLRENEWTVADAGRDADLEALVRAVPDPEAVLWAGSAGLAAALGVVYPGPGGAADAGRPAARRVLVVIGSLSGVSREQLRRLTDEYGNVAVPVGVGRRGAVRRAVAAARRALSGGACAVVHSPGRASVGTRAETMKSLAAVAAGLSGGDAFDALVLTGGATAVGVSRRVGAAGIRLEGEVEAGVPVGTLIGEKPYPVVTKAGAFGGPGTLVGAVKHLRAEGEGT